MIPTQITIHYTASSRDRTTIEDINAWHKLRWPDFKSSLNFWSGYHFIITGNGKITQTRRENEIGAHSIPNEGKIGIALTGNFMIELPSPIQLTSLQSLLEDIKKRYNWDDEQIKAHKELNPTECPGKYLMEWLEKYRKISFLKKQIEAIKRLIEFFLKGRKTI